jgi:hypothetical protein
MPDRKGGCLCGAVRYVLIAGQSRELGRLASALRPRPAARCSSGQPVYRHFCGRCGSPILAKTTLAPGRVVVKASTLDSTEGLQPQTEIYTDHALKWLAPLAGARFAQNINR